MFAYIMSTVHEIIKERKKKLEDYKGKINEM